jgi:hypothetical protein
MNEEDANPIQGEETITYDQKGEPMRPRSPVFEENYQYYLRRIQEADLKNIAGKLGAWVEKDELIIPFFQNLYRISGRGVTGARGERPEYFISVVLFKYVLLCPENEPHAGEWRSFRDFRDAAPLITYFSANVKTALERHFSGRLKQLESACKTIGGHRPGIELRYDLAMEFDALPKIPILLLFNDREDEFPAQCQVLFAQQTENHLDMECTAGLGHMLADLLIRSDKQLRN